MKQNKKNGSVKRTVLIIVCTVLALIFTAMLGITIYVESLMNKINRDVDNSTLSSSEIEELLQEEATGTSPTLNEEDIDFGDAPAQTIGGDGIINILLIGQDRREGQGRQRSDAMILCTINTNSKTLTMTSFLRDIYVKVPGYYDNKINACYVIGGMELLDAALETNFGIQVDANIEVDFNGFMELIDMMGGVDIELTKDEALYLNRRGNWDVTGNDGWSLVEGMNHLNGSQALAYSRIRAIGTDFGRTERQRKVITALIGQVKEMSLLEINALANQAVSLITTDMTNQEITGYIMTLVPMLSDLTINTQRVPVDGSYKFGDVGKAVDCIIIDFEKNRQMLAETLLN